MRHPLIAEKTQKCPKSVDLGHFCVCSRRENYASVPMVGSASYASVKFRVTDGSTGIPGPVVVETVTFLR
jgi:hypothetical protein